LTEESIRGRIAIKKAYFKGPIEVGAGITIAVEAQNIGHASAAVWNFADSKRWKSLPDGEMPVSVDSKKDLMSLEPDGTQTVMLFHNNAVSEGYLKELLTRNGTTPHFFGRFTYESFGKKHFTEFCFLVFPMNTEHLPDTPATASLKVDGRFGLKQCDKWHTVH